MSTSAPETKNRKNLVLFLVGGLLVVLGLAFFVSPFASSSPDGLNKVAIDQGFSGDEQPHAVGEGPFAGYGVKGVDDEGLSTGLAGVIGVAITFGAAMILFGLIRVQADRKRRAESSPAGT